MVLDSGDGGGRGVDCRRWKGGVGKEREWEGGRKGGVGKEGDSEGKEKMKSLYFALKLGIKDKRK